MQYTHPTPNPAAYIEPSHMVRAMTLQAKADKAERPTRSLEDRVEDMLSCYICHDLAYEAVTAECGHLFCYYCLIKWSLDTPRADPVNIAHNLNGFTLTCPACDTKRFQVALCPAIDRMIEQIYPQRIAERAHQNIEQRLKDFMLPTVRAEIARQLAQEERGRVLAEQASVRNVQAAEIIVRPQPLAAVPQHVRGAEVEFTPTHFWQRMKNIRLPASVVGCILLFLAIMIVGPLPKWYQYASLFGMWALWTAVYVWENPNRHGGNRGGNIYW